MENTTESIAAFIKIGDGIYVDEWIYNVFVALIFILILITISLLMMLTLNLVFQVKIWTTNRQVISIRKPSSRCLNLQVARKAKNSNFANIV